MTDHRDDHADPPRQGEPEQYNRFESLARRLLKVSKDELREAEKAERDNRRLA